MILLGLVADQNAVFSHCFPRKDTTRTRSNLSGELCFCPGNQTEQPPPNPKGRIVLCTCGHPTTSHDNTGCTAWVFGVPYPASAGRCRCSQLIVEDYEDDQ